MNSGLLLRGVLLGIKDSKDTWNDKNTGEQKQRTFKEIGVEIEYTNGFNHKQKLTKTARVFDAKLQDSSFIKGLQDNHMKTVEIAVFVNYGKLAVEGDAIIQCIEPQLSKVS